MSTPTRSPRRPSLKRRQEQLDLDIAAGVRLLCRRDATLRPVAREHGPPTFRLRENYFDILVESVISQQISGAAAESILRKLSGAFGGIYTPESIAAAPDELIRGAGVSPQKLGYLRSLAGHVIDGRLELDRLPDLSNEEVIAELTDVKGIGVWTAHMFLMFSLGRLDVLPVGDLGVKKGLQRVLGLDALPTPSQVAEIAEQRRWAPYRSVASWYMWRLAS